MATGEQHSKKDKIMVIDWLIEHFPQAFFKKANQIKPLQIGIFEDIVEYIDRIDYPPFSKKALREAINFYSSSPSYLLSQKPNTARVDIFGNEIDIVTEEQAKYAQQRHAERYITKKTTENAEKKKESPPACDTIDKKDQE